LNEERDATAGPLIGIDRRRFLRRVAATGSVVWAVPALVSADPAGAQEPGSPPPTPPRPPGAEPAGETVVVAPSETSRAPDAQHITTLPRTGTDADEYLFAGLAAIAAGAALTTWGNELAAGAAAVYTPKHLGYHAKHLARPVT
jgi:hypothetical protein